MPISGAPLTPPQESFMERFLQNIKTAAATGNVTCLIDEGKGKEYTYDQLYKNASSIAINLKKMGVVEGTTVVILNENSFETFSFAIGVFFSKGTACAINYNLKADEIRKMLQISKAKIIYVGEKYTSLAEEAINNIGWDIKLITEAKTSKYENYSKLVNEDVSKFTIKISDPEKHIFAILFTSGTTGVPKGVMLKDRGASNNAICLDWITNEKKILLTSPMFWISNIMVLTKSLCDKKIVIIPGDVTAENVAKCIMKTKPECWFTGAAILLEMCQLPNIKNYDNSSMKNLYVGGSALLTEHKKLIVGTVLKGRNILKNIYGSTEAGLITCCSQTPDIDSPQYNSLGNLAAGVSLKVVDITNGKELGPHQEGEFCVKTACMMAGYINEGIKDDYDSEGWWHMGDIGYYDKEGYIYYISRLKEVFKYRGLQIAPAELETILLRHPGVYEASVVGKPHVVDGEWPTAFIVKKDPSITEKELEEFVAGQVPDSKRLRGGVHFLDSFPRSAVGKILKSELIKLLN